MPGDADFYYEGFSSPNGTIVPDDVFDVLAPRLKESELRVLLYIVRRTFGFGKNADAISLSQMTDGITTRDGRIIDHGTGMSKRAVIQGVKGLATKGIIEVDRKKASRGHNAVNVYRLRFRSEDGVVTESNHYGNPPSPPLVSDGNPQQTDSQETEEHNNSTVVADEKHKVRDEALYEALKEAGVHHNTAAKLLREHDEDRIRLVLDHVRDRILHGWMPNESAAAWIVAAVRDDYELPQERTEAWAVSVSAEKAVELSDQQEERVRADFRQARRQRAQELTGDVQTDELWLEVQEGMKADGTWLPVLASSFLCIEDGRATVLVPAIMVTHASGMEDAISEALEKHGMVADDCYGVRIRGYSR
jgi:hypothetical protein